MCQSIHRVHQNGDKLKQGSVASSEVIVSSDRLKQLAATTISCEADNGFITVAMAAGIHPKKWPLPDLTPHRLAESFL